MFIYTYKYCWEDPEKERGWDAATVKTRTATNEMEAVNELEKRFNRLVFVRKIGEQEIKEPVKTTNVNKGYKEGLQSIKAILGEAADFKKCIQCEADLPRERKLKVCTKCSKENQKGSYIK